MSHVTLERRFVLGSSLVGTFRYESREFWSIEKLWRGNVPYHSSVPMGLYGLVAHHGTQYPDTFALVGDTVSASPDQGKARFACVIHRALDGAQLAGCIAIGTQLTATGQLRREGLEATDELIEYLKAKNEPHSFLITGSRG